MGAPSDARGADTSATTVVIADTAEMQSRPTGEKTGAGEVSVSSTGKCLTH